MDPGDQVVRQSADPRTATHRRRRPTGAAPPLPKQIGYTGWLWLVLLLAVVVTGCLWLRVDPGPLDRFDAWITDVVISVRTGWLEALARQAHTVGSRIGFAALGLLLVVATAWFHRWRFGAIVGVAIPLAAFRAFAPNDHFPVSYGAHGKAAHLDVTGRRGEAIRTALRDQLGFAVHIIKPVGLEGSGGSTPLKLTVTDEDGRQRTIFAKLYAKSHVRADRWYKLGRTILYGSLEDETPFTTVRRFVEYEDYTLRMLGEYGFTTPAPLGIVEITPEREYLIAMDFFDDAVEIGEAEIGASVIDEGLAMIRQMWDIGLAHRDIKPANLMVQRGKLKLIDVFFVQVRPTPWRQAVDLGNMMLVLALRSDARTVYDAALRYFTPDELAEAFAATRGVASPTQLRQQMKQDGRDLLAEFRSMAPARRPIAVQRWSVRRVVLIVASLVVLLLAGLTAVGLFFPTRGAVTAPTCGPGLAMQLMAQAVPTATQLPCISRLPYGWGVSTAETVRGRAIFAIGSGGGASDDVTVTLSGPCPAPVAGTRQIPMDGGCVTYRLAIADPDAPSFDSGGGLSFTPRTDLVAAVDADGDQVLCGALAPACP